MRRWIMAVVAAAVLVPGGARALCVPTWPCVCASDWIDFTTLGVAQVTATDGTTATVEVLEVHGQAGSMVVGDRVELEGAPDLQIGDEVLLQGAGEFVPIQPNGVIVCEDGFLVSTEKAIALGLSDDCTSEAEAIGWESPPCNDTPACATGGAGAAPAWLVALLLLTGAAVHRRRRATA